MIFTQHLDQFIFVDRRQQAFLGTNVDAERAMKGTLLGTGVNLIVAIMFVLEKTRLL